MSRARNLADLLDSNGDVVSGALDNVATPTPFDDNKLVNDVSTIALRIAVSENAVAYNTNSQFIDVFQDNSGITNLTNAVRDSGEYISTYLSTTTSIAANINGGNSQTPAQTASGSSSYTGYDGVTRSNGQIGDPGGYHSYAIGNLFAANEDFEVIVFVDGSFQGTGYVYGSGITGLGNIGTFRNGGYVGDNSGDAFSSFSQGTYRGKYHSPLAGDGGSNYKNLYRWSRENGTFKLQYYGRTTGTLTVDSTSIANVRASTNYVDVIGSPRTITDQIVCLVGEAGSISKISIEVANTTSTTTSATGSFENNAITASSSVSSMGAIITYEDNAGTNALNTDIVLQLSADGGSNWSTATLSALPNYSSTIKMAKVNDLAVTAGTSLKYKLSFANQSSGSKLARIRGVALQY